MRKLVLLPALLCLLMLNPARAQEAEASGAETRAYDLTGLTWSEFASSAEAGKPQDWLAPDRLFENSEGANEQELHWRLRNCTGGARCFGDIEDLTNAVLSLCADGQEASYSTDVTGGPRIRLTCSAEIHRRFAWVLEALQAAAKTEVRLTAVLLPAAPGAEIRLEEPEAVKLAAAGTLLGATSGALGEVLALQQLEVCEFAQGLEPDSPERTGQTSPRMARLAAGRELLAGALLLPDGRVWVHGWSGRQNLKAPRKDVPGAALVDLPVTTWSYVPFSGLVANGGALVVDEGAQRLMVRVQIKGSLPNRTLECGPTLTLGLVNVSGALLGLTPPAPWLCGAASDTAHLRLGQSSHQAYESLVHGCASTAACRTLAERVGALAGGAVSSIVALGPWLGIMFTQPGETEAPGREFEAARREITAALAAINAGPAALGFRVRAWRSKNPGASVLGGRPQAADLSALGTPLLDRCVAMTGHQTCDVLDLELMSRVAAFQPATADAGATLDTAVVAFGTQFRLCARPHQDQALATLRLAWAEGERKPLRSEGVETFTRQLAQAELSADLDVGAMACCVVPAPGGEGHLIVSLQRTR
ncbi:hypothetical protein EDM80_02275 [bacterium]|nr:MAG: hypothetical protein EDM80_02275 [bacterium]RIK62327.1 MAG: hypothetical protein DCC64_10390 [Planctomycetota bacterium]